MLLLPLLLLLYLLLLVNCSTHSQPYISSPSAAAAASNL